MINKEKITISIDSKLLSKIDEKVDKVNFKNRSNVIESFIREGLRLKNDTWALIIANDENWNDENYPLSFPKILINVDWKTLLEKHLEMLQEANIENVILALGHWKKEVKEFLKKKNFPINVNILDVKPEDKTQLVIEKAKKFTLQDKLIVILWDNYHNNFNLLDFIYYHNTSGASLSMVVRSNSVSEGYWNIKLEWNNIVGFIEKPQKKEDITFIINAWIYIVDVNIIPETGKNLKIENDFFPDYVSTKVAKAYFHNWNWFHMQDNKTLNLFY